MTSAAEGPVGASARAPRLALLRAINVGGRNKVLMADLRACFEAHGHTDVSTYIASGNVIFRPEPKPEPEPQPGSGLEPELETMLSDSFGFRIPVLVRDGQQLQHIVSDAPAGFGRAPDTFHCDVMFLRRQVDPVQAVSEIPVRDGVDVLHPGDGVIYAQRLSAELSSSRLSRITGKPIYQQMSIRTWRTTLKLLDRMR